MNQMKPLCDLKSGQQGYVASLQLNDVKLIQTILSMGIRKDSIVRVINACKKYVVFRADQREFAIDHEIAAHILVLTRETAAATPA
jgi:Fe2+ transport system protein FeoA